MLDRNSTYEAIRLERAKKQSQRERELKESKRNRLLNAARMKKRAKTKKIPKDKLDKWISESKKVKSFMDTPKKETRKRPKLPVPNIKYIYEISRNDTPIYIGCSCNPMIRYVSHKKRFGGGVKISIIDCVPISQWEFWEIHYIALYRSFGFDLENKHRGGVVDLREYSIKNNVFAEL